MAFSKILVPFDGSVFSMRAFKAALGIAKRKNSVVHVSSDQSVADIIDIMANKDIRKVPVIDNGKVLGIVTGTEFLRLFVQASDADLQKAYQEYVKRVYSKWFKE